MERKELEKSIGERDLFEVFEDIQLHLMLHSPDGKNCHDRQALKNGIPLRMNSEDWKK